MAASKGERLGQAAQAVAITGSLRHGHVAAVHAMAAKLGLPALLGPPCRARDLALAEIVSRVVQPGSKLPPLAPRIDARGDGLAGRTGRTRSRPRSPRRHLAPAANPG